MYSAKDGRIDYYLADVITANDYYPFGMLQPGRKYSGGSGYRYGFNGKENDKDVKGDGNQQDYGMRIYDSRLSRFLSVDPLTNKYPELTPYQFASNTPLQAIDLDGLEAIKYEFKKYNYSQDGSLLGAAKNLIKIFPNIAANVGNGGVTLINTVCYNVSYLKNNGIGNYLTATGSQWKQGAQDVKSAAVNGVDYLKTTSASQKVDDFSNFISSPTTWESFGTGYVSGKLFSIGVTQFKSLNFSTDLPIGTKTSGFGFSRSSSSLVKKVGEFKLTHTVETIVNSQDYKVLSKLSDEELIKSVTNPKNYNSVTLNTETGTLFDGNTRIYELQRRGLTNVEVPYKEYTPDNSMFPQLKEPPKK